MHSPRLVRSTGSVDASTPCPRRTGIALIASAGVAWGTAPVAFHIVYQRTSLGAVAISAHRLAIAAGVLIVVVLLRGHLRTVGSELRARAVRSC